MADEMRSAILATFENEETASGWVKYAHDNDLKVLEGIVLRKDPETGKVHEHLTNLPGIGIGAGVGAAIGAVLGIVFPPVIIGEALVGAAGVAVAGAAASAGAIALKDELMTRNSFKDAADALEPGQSALVVVMASADADAFEAAITDAVGIWKEELPDTE